MPNKKNNPKTLLSVIIPAKNSLTYLTEAIRSILGQDFPCQIIVIDDGSSPSFLLPLQKNFPQVQVVRNKVSRGPAAARNQGLKRAGGNYVTFLDSDDYWKPNFAKVMVDACKNSEGAVLCFSFKIFSSEFGFNRRVVFWLLNTIRDLALKFMFMFRRGILSDDGFYLAQVSHMLFHKKAIEGVSFDESYKFAEDWKFVLEVQKRTRIKIVPQKLLSFRYHHQSLSFKNSEKWLFYRRVLDELPPTIKKRFFTKLFYYYLNFFSRLTWVLW
jgi:glycosyltransferase involved in cell wall biosynthesis